jgi:hypothetical protein
MSAPAIAGGGSDGLNVAVCGEPLKPSSAARPAELNNSLRPYPSIGTIEEGVNPAPSDKDPGGTRAWQPRFGIRGVLLLVLVVCVMAAGGNYLVLALRGGRSFQLAFILFTLSAPLLVLVAVSVAYAVFRRRK